MFEDDDAVEVAKPKVGINPALAKKSQQYQRPPTQEEFGKQVDAVRAKIGEKHAALADTAKDFVALVKDKTLPQNRSITAANKEKNVIQTLLNLIEEINSDENEKENFGTYAVLSLLIKANLAQRDRINELSHEVSLLRENLALR
jgi:hypothetical protein